MPLNPEIDNTTSTRRAVVRRYHGEEWAESGDELAAEEPLQIRLAGEDVAVTMRTPGYDAELAVGFLFSEGIIAAKEDIEEITYCLSYLPGESEERNVINVLPTKRELLEPGRWGRNFISSSSCGLCGATTINQVMRVHGERKGAPTMEALGHTTPWPLSASLLYSLPAKLRAVQETFTQTGGLHAAALFTTEGELLVMREDVGRHNAVDKAVGHALLNGWLPLNRHILLVSSRASYEIIQKAIFAGIELVAVISAPSSLAVEMAQEAGTTLVGFLREERLNVYSEEWRIA